MLLIIHDGRYCFLSFSYHIISQHNQVNTGCPHIFLSSGIDAGKPVKFHRSGENITAHIGYQRHIHLGNLMPLCSFYCIVGGDMKILGISRQRCWLSNTGMFTIGGIGSSKHISKKSGFFCGFLSPNTINAISCSIGSI